VTEYLAKLCQEFWGLRRTANCCQIPVGRSDPEGFCRPEFLPHKMALIARETGLGEMLASDREIDPSFVLPEPWMDSPARPPTAKGPGVIPGHLPGAVVRHIAILNLSKARSRKRCKMGSKLVSITNRKSYTWAFDWYQNRWPWMTLNGVITLTLGYFTGFSCTISSQNNY